jgi:hypothetical protein
MELDLSIQAGLAEAFDRADAEGVPVDVWLSETTVEVLSRDEGPSALDNALVIYTAQPSVSLENNNAAVIDGVIAAVNTFKQSASGGLATGNH